MAKSLHDFCIEHDDFELLQQWDEENNGDLTPRNVSYGSHKRIHWKCASGHQWMAAVYSRAGAGTKCPYCKGRKTAVASDKSLAARYPNLLKEWHPTKNPDISPSDVLPGSHRKVWWICSKGHEWQAQIKSRTEGSGCPVCTNREVRVGENDLATTHPILVHQWHISKNGTLAPQMFVAGSLRKVWWVCERGHEWKATIASRASNGNGCPVCDGKQVVAGENDLCSLFPEIAAEWHPTQNGNLFPQQVTPYSNRRVWWLCSAGHAYTMAIAARTSRGSDCPYCTGRKVLQGFNDLATLEPELAAQWHPELNGNLMPEMITTGSHKKVWWQCQNGHAWKTVVYSRAKAKSGCPVCAGKVSEEKQKRYLSMMADL